VDGLYEKVRFWAVFEHSGVGEVWIVCIKR